MGAGGCQHQALLHPTGQSQSATSSSIPHSSYFMLLILLLVPASFWAILLLLFLASSILGTSAISTLLVLAVAGGMSVGPPGWGHTTLCGGSVLFHPLVFPQGIGWWHPPAAVPEGSGQWFPRKSPGTGSPPLQRGRRWLRRWHGTLGSSWVQSLVSYPRFSTLELYGRSSQEGTEHILVASLWLLEHFIPTPCPISAQMFHPGCPILGASSRGIQERTGHILMAFLWFLGISSQLPDFREGCGEAREVHVSIVVVAQKSPR